MLNIFLWVACPPYVYSLVCGHIHFVGKPAGRYWIAHQCSSNKLLIVAQDKFKCMAHPNISIRMKTKLKHYNIVWTPYLIHHA